MTTIYMVRHAESPYMEGSERTRGLSIEGRKKAQQAAELLVNEGINLIVSSPYARAVLTVEGLAKKLNLDIIEIEDLRERHFAGDDYRISDEEFVLAFKRMFEDYSYTLPGGESNRDCQNRAVAALKTILTEHNGSKIAIGTHGNVMTLMMGYFDSSYGFDFLMQTDKPDVYKLEFDGLELMSVTRLWEALKTKPTIRHASTIFFVSDRVRTMEYYKKLGFSCDGSFGFVQRDGFEIIIHETKNTAQIRPNYPSHGQDALDMFSMVTDVESLYEEFKSAGTEFRYPIRVTEYGMKEFAILDPDGYTIGFGESLND